MGILSALTRRRLLGGAAGALAMSPTLAPARARTAAPAREPAGPDSAPATEFVLEIRATTGPAIVLGQSDDGLRRLVPVTGGRFEGLGLRGEVLPGGGEWQLVRPDGVTTLDAKYTLRTEEGTLVAVTHRGLVAPDQASGAGGHVHTVPEFEAPRGAYEWLNRAVFAGALDSSRSSEGRALLRVFRVV